MYYIDTGSIFPSVLANLGGGGNNKEANNKINSIDISYVPFYF